MPRIARVVVPDVPHHVTHRGNNGQPVFMEAEDFRTYLHIFQKYRTRHGLALWAYELLTNHVHHVAVPASALALSRTIRDAHSQYAQYVNRKYERSGHLWGSRFYSCPMDETYLWHCVRYVETNAVRASLAAGPGLYPWSSGKARMTGMVDPFIDADCPLLERFGPWHEYLDNSANEEFTDGLRACTSTGRPAGSPDFVRRIGHALERRLRKRPHGRPARPMAA